MDRSRLQEAVSLILTSYLTSHKIEPDQVPNLVTSVGQALATRERHAESGPDLNVLPRNPIRRVRRRGKHPSDPDSTRIEHPDQPDMFGVVEAEVVEALIGESAGERDTAEREVSVVDVDVEAEDRPRRGPRSSRAIAEAEVETAIEDGVPVTRLPEVKRRRKT